jgi:hypothetical protein
MTLFHKELVSCPHCLNEEEITVWDQLDAQSDPDLKEKLLRKELQVFDCRNCGRRHLLAHPMLYRDDDKKLVIWCDPAVKALAAGFESSELSKKLPAPHGYHLRLASEVNQMIELIHLYENRIDERIMEIVKLAVLAWQKEEIKVTQLRYLSSSRERILFLALGDDGQWYQLPVAFSLYEQLEAHLYSQLPPEKGWLNVNQDLAQPYFKLLEQ